MKVILCDNVTNLGEMGATVNVSDGYARNYLLPRKLAVLVESGSAKQIEHELRIIRKKEEKKRAALKDVAKTLESLTLEFKARAGENEKIFGSVTTANIAAKLKELGHDVDRKQILLEEPIKSLGIFVVPVRLMSGVQADVKVWVAPEQEEAAESKESEEESEE